MRISDWSSDVCSSDLGRLPRSARRRSPSRPDRREPTPRGDPTVPGWKLQTPARRYGRRCGRELNLDMAFTIPLISEYTSLFFLEKIGRASCRDRVCQYV